MGKLLTNNCREGLTYKGILLYVMVQCLYNQHLRAPIELPVTDQDYVCPLRND